MKPAIARTLTTLVHGLLRGLFRAWVLVVPLVLALSLIRLGQLAYFWPTGFHVSTTDLASVVVQGFRFDLKVSAVAGFIVAGAALGLGQGAGAHRDGRGLFVCDAVAGQPALLRFLQDTD